MGEENELSVRDLLKKSYERLEERNAHQRVVFENNVSTEIANDSDWHRIRKGYMKYDSADVFTFNGRDWAVGRGERSGSYPSRPYDSDIIAFLVEDVPEKTEEKIGDEIKQGTYFRNSVLVGMSDGSLKGKDGMKSLLEHRMQGMIASEIEVNSKLIDPNTLGPVVRKPYAYKHQAVDIVTESLEEFLGSD